MSRRQGTPRRSSPSSSVPPSTPQTQRSSSPPPGFSSSPRSRGRSSQAAESPFEDETEQLRQQDDNIVDDDQEGEGEDLIGDGMEDDYRAIPELDNYDAQDLADEAEEVEDLSPGARRLAERSMKKRDKASARGAGQGRGGNVLDRFADDNEDDDDVGRDPLSRNRNRRRAERAAGVEGGDDLGFDQDDDATIIENLEDRKGHTLRDWIVQEPVEREIFKRFKSFLKAFIDSSGNTIHLERITEMCEQNRESLVISYTDLCTQHPVLAIYVADAPTEMLTIFDRAAKEVVLEQFPDYEKICPEIHVRVKDLPVSDQIRDIRQMHLNALIKVNGVVTRRTGIFPQLKLAKYVCAKCNAQLGPFVVHDSTEQTKISSCPECQSKGPFTLNAEETIYRNYQKITIQESPGSVPPGRLPRNKDVILLWDLVDGCKPGDEIELTGTYKNNFDYSLNARHGFPIFSTVIEANYVVSKADKFANVGLTDEDLKEIRALSKQENIGERVFKSIAPSIYGHDDIKIALALALLSGEAKELENKMRVRGDINVLMLGDPGTAKSQFLKYVEKVSPRAVFTTGQGASAVGLTASVARDPLTREWTLQGGALVLADQGVCLIDEFDKMNDQDRTSIHEAMEQQTISISKAGIITSLQARCAVIAAANPIKGKYQPGLTFSQNVDLTEPIISRFDILCVVKDVVDAFADERLASFVVKNHVRHHPEFDDEEEKVEVDPLIIPQETLRKYFLHAKRTVHPKLHNMDQDKIATLYQELRKESAITGSIPITVRQVDSIIRLSEAHAKLHLRDYVRDDDVNMAIRVIVSSFVETQKFSIAKQMQRVFSKYITYKKDNNDLLFFVLSQLGREEISYQHASNKKNPGDSIEIDAEDFAQRAKQIGVYNLAPFYKSNQFVDSGYELDEPNNPKLLIKQF